MALLPPGYRKVLPPGYPPLSVLTLTGLHPTGGFTMPIRRGPYTNQPVGGIGVPSTSTYTTGEDIAGNLIVVITNGLVYRADPTVPAFNPFSVIGMSQGAAPVGTPITVVQRGSCPGVSGLTPNATYFLGPGGLATPVSPTTGVQLVIGTAADAGTYNIKLGTPVSLC